MSSIRDSSADKMVVFDMDSVLLRRRFIDECAERFNFRQALNLLRQIDHDPVSQAKRTASFLKGQKKTVLVEVARSIPLVEDVTSLLEELKKRSYKIGIISESYEVVTKPVADLVNADFWICNELQYEGEYVTGEVMIPLYFHYSDESVCRHGVCKTNALLYACRKYNIALENCVVIGDSDNDICMMSHAGTGVAFSAVNELLKSVA